jgi:nitrogen fixation-related uncharacterized protein
MMNTLSLLVALAALVFFWWPIGVFVFEGLTGKQDPRLREDAPQNPFAPRKPG